MINVPTLWRGNLRLGERDNLLRSKQLVHSSAGTQTQCHAMSGVLLMQDVGITPLVDGARKLF